VPFPKDSFPRWFRPKVDFNEFPQDWTYVYDNTPLAQTIEKYVDFKKLSPGSLYADQENDPNTIRLIVTAASVLTAEPIVFDSGKIQINVKHLLASTGSPISISMGRSPEECIWMGRCSLK
jgi:predicted acylesterase/phospholipase RssA